MNQVIRELNKYLQGWIGYFKIQEFKYLFRDLDAWIRSRLRSTQLKKWKKPQKFQRIMIKVGFNPGISNASAKGIRKVSRRWQPRAWSHWNEDGNEVVAVLEITGIRNLCMYDPN